METFITTTLNNLKSGNYGDLTLVLGNESCDLDSAASALVYAAFLNWQYNQIKCKVCTRNNRDESVYKNDIFVPVLNVSREDYSLKTEVVFCLKEHGIDESKLVFRNDCDLREMVSKCKTSVVLVDHHKLGRHDNFLAPYVTEIIDHRPLDKTEWEYKPDTRTTIETTGSCCTLVAQRIRSLSTLMSKDRLFFESHPVCVDLLHCTIILDTVNFSKEVDKATPQDREVVEFLETFLKQTNSADDRKCKLERLVEARKDVSSLTPAQLLRKDVKIVGQVLVPSFPILVEDFLNKPKSFQAIEDALNRSECNIAVILGMCLEKGLKRDVAIYSKNGEDLTMFIHHLTEWSRPPLQLTQTALANAPGVVYFVQNYLPASRKQYIQAISEFYKSSRNQSE